MIVVRDKITLNMRIFGKTIYIGLILFIALLVSGSFFCFFASRANAAVHNRKMMASNIKSSFTTRHNSPDKSLPQCCVDQRSNEKVGVFENFGFQERLVAMGANCVNFDFFIDSNKNVKISLSDTSPPERNFLASVIKKE